MAYPGDYSIHISEKCVFCYFGVVFYIYVRYSWFLVLFKFPASLLFFSLVFLSIIENGVLNFLSTIGELFISPFSFQFLVHMFWG